MRLRPPLRALLALASLILAAPATEGPARAALEDAAAGAVAEKPGPPAVGVTRRTIGAAVRFDAVTPGRLVGYALPRVRSGAREILLLVAPEPGAGTKEAAAAPPPAGAPPCPPAQEEAGAAPPPRLLLRVELSDSGGGLVTLRDDLPSDAGLLDAMDLDGDGIEEILVGRPGELLVLRDAEGRRGVKGPDLLMKDPYFATQAGWLVEPRLVRSPAFEGIRILPVETLGAVRFYGPDAAGLSWDLRCEAALPLEAADRTADLLLTSPRTRLIGRPAGGGLLFASGPEPSGWRRLRSVLIDPEAGGEARRVERWSLLPGDEEVLESRYLMLMGRPALLVATRRADKLSLFGEKKLRLFLLDEPDRTDVGGAPLFAVESHMNLWQAMSPVALDADGDGREDLVVGYWKGLKESRAVLDLYAGKGDGAFSRSPSTTELEVRDGLRSFLEFGRDLDGDGLADLLVVGDGSALLFKGTRTGRGLVERPAWLSVPVSFDAREREGSDPGFVISFGGGGGTRVAAGAAEGGRGPRVIDLDGDGRPEILLSRRDEAGRGRLQVIRLAPR